MEMESKDLYNYAVRLMENVKLVEPNLVSGRDAEFCVMITDRQHVFAGVTSVKISAGQLMRACPEYNAIMALSQTDEDKVDQLITISFATREVSQPCESCIKLLCETNPENRFTDIYIAANRSVKAIELLAPGSLGPEDQFDPEGESTEDAMAEFEVPDPAEFETPAPEAPEVPAAQAALDIDGFEIPPEMAMPASVQGEPDPSFTGTVKPDDKPSIESVFADLENEFVNAQAEPDPARTFTEQTEEEDAAGEPNEFAEEPNEFAQETPAPA